MTKAAVRAEAEAIFAAFQAAGAQPVEADILLPAGTLLDLYGEDIRARAYVTSDPLRGEMMLRPDFTVPVVQAHMAAGADPARYTYMGEVFRRQEHLGPRASEYLQVGFEVFDRSHPEAVDADVFGLIAEVLAPLGLQAATGDFGILLAAVRGLSTSDKRKSALLRHVWRPQRFRALLDRFAGRTPVPEPRLRLLERLAAASPEALMDQSGPAIGLREPEDVAARVAALIEDARTPPINPDEAAVLDDLLLVEAPAGEALARLEALAARMPAMAASVQRFAGRLDALAARGVAVDRLPFAAGHGQSTLEYYDGFVFSFHADDPTLPPVSSGGRYDALTAVLGQGHSIPAVGGVIRPGLVAQLKGTA
ncbi:ATP phosphoribosyltransferase regulatory subunit [Rhodobacter sp. CZR27]|uniref:ATP phosphoribosyltransferase regulatory subunit n=1 Tax=Rhodobacter sp. CZR27 TaxID=2033869 RepID=UPI000BBEC22F|nr:ATP phosphoribosyltransferase regulatory subunit [Rhodobacter sp. CZR27]